MRKADEEFTAAGLAANTQTQNTKEALETGTLGKHQCTPLTQTLEHACMVIRKAGNRWGG